MRLLTRIHEYAGRVFYFFPYLKFLPVSVLTEPSSTQVLDKRKGGEARESTKSLACETSQLDALIADQEKDSRGGHKFCDVLVINGHCYCPGCIAGKKFVNG